MNTDDSVKIVAENLRKTQDRAKWKILMNIHNDVMMTKKKKTIKRKNAIDLKFCLYFALPAIRCMCVCVYKFIFALRKFFHFLFLLVSWSSVVVFCKGIRTSFLRNY